MRKPELQVRELADGLAIDLDSDGELRVPVVVSKPENGSRLAVTYLSAQTVDGRHSTSGKNKVEHRSGKRRIQELLVGVLLLYGVGVIIAVVASSIAGQWPLLSQLLTSTILPAIPFIIFMIVVLYVLNYYRRWE